MSPAPKRPQTLILRVNGELADAFREYMDAQGYVSPSEAVREILTIYFASNPVDAVVVAARQNAMNQAKHWVLTRLTQTFSELERDMRAETIGIEQSGYGR